MGKYPALTVIAGIFRVLGIIIGVVGVFVSAGLVGRSQFSLLPSFMTSLGAGGIIGSILIALVMYASGDLLICVIDIEANTRAGQDTEPIP